MEAAQHRRFGCRECICRIGAMSSLRIISARNRAADGNPRPSRRAMPRRTPSFPVSRATTRPITTSRVSVSAGRCGCFKFLTTDFHPWLCRGIFGCGLLGARIRALLPMALSGMPRFPPAGENHRWRQPPKPGRLTWRNWDRRKSAPSDRPCRRRSS